MQLYDKLLFTIVDMQLSYIKHLKFRKRVSFFVLSWLEKEKSLSRLGKIYTILQNANVKKNIGLLLNEIEMLFEGDETTF